jgi:hypothetical protein
LVFRRPTNYYPFSISLITEFTNSTNVMTGYKTGAMALTERLLGKPVHWFICFSHLNELLWRRYLIHIVSPTKSPTRWTSDWFNLDKVESLPVVEFAAVPNPEFPDPPIATIKSFSQDQQLFFALCQAIMSGYQRNPDQHHAPYTSDLE